MSKPINENPNPAPRYPAPAIQINPPNSRDATIALLTCLLRACEEHERATTQASEREAPNGS